MVRAGVRDQREGQCVVEGLEGARPTGMKDDTDPCRLLLRVRRNLVEREGVLSGVVAEDVVRPRARPARLDVSTDIPA